MTKAPGDEAQGPCFVGDLATLTPDSGSSLLLGPELPAFVSLLRDYAILSIRRKGCRCRSYSLQNIPIDPGPLVADAGGPDHEAAKLAG